MHKIDTPRGPIEYDEHQVLRVDDGLVGFAQARRFVLVESDDLAPLRWLVAVDSPDLSFLVVDARQIVPTYELRLSAVERAKLGVEDASELLPLAITVVAESPEDATANLKAPILVNSREMTAAQVILTECDYSVRQSLLTSGVD